MKFGLVTKLDKRNTVRLKRFDEFSESCDVIVIFPIYSQFGAIRKPYPGRKIIKLTFSIIATFYLAKTENITKTFITQLLYYCFE